jgi:hypothetical protein
MAPEAPVSIPALAAGRGGGSALEGVSGLMHNPATLKWRGGGQAEMGFVALSEGLSPYAALGYQEPDGPAGAFGGFQYSVDGYPYQGVMGGFSWPLGDDASFGLAVTGAFAKGDFGADGHAGLWMRLGEHGESGLFVRNAMASGLGEAPSGFNSEREVGFGIGSVYETVALWRLHIHDIGFRYDMSTLDWQPQEWRHTVSGEAWLPPAGSLGLLFGLTLDGSDPVPQLSLGGGIKLPLAGGALRLIYAMSPNSSQALGLRYEVGRQRDVLAPVVRIEAWPARTSIDSIAHTGLYFKLGAEDPDGQPASWELVLLQTDGTGRLGEAVMRYHGKELPPRLIRWAGENIQGQRLPVGMYAYRFEASDKAGHTTVAPLGLIELMAQEP